MNQTIVRRIEGESIYFPQDDQEARIVLAANHGKRLEILMFIQAEQHILSDVIATIAVDGLSFNCRKHRGRNWWHAGMLDSIFSIKVLEKSDI